MRGLLFVFIVLSKRTLFFLFFPDRAIVVLFFRYIINNHRILPHNTVIISPSIRFSIHAIIPQKARREIEQLRYKYILVPTTSILSIHSIRNRPLITTMTLSSSSASAYSSPSSIIPSSSTCQLYHLYAQQLNNSAALCIEIGHYERAISSLKRALLLVSKAEKVHRHFRKQSTFNRLQ